MTYVEKLINYLKEGDVGEPKSYLAVLHFAQWLDSLDSKPQENKISVSPPAHRSSPAIDISVEALSKPKCTCLYDADRVRIDSTTCPVHDKCDSKCADKVGLKEATHFHAKPKPQIEPLKLKWDLTKFSTESEHFMASYISRIENRLNEIIEVLNHLTKSE